VEQQIGDHEAQHCVAEELEGFVVDDAAGRVLVRARPMREGVLEQAQVREFVPDLLLERSEVLGEICYESKFFFFDF
jgi:hypothetical protein